MNEPKRPPSSSEYPTFSPPKTSLCNSCTKWDFKAELFLPPFPAGCPPSQNHPLTRIIPLQQVREAQHTCSLCRLLLKTAYLTPGAEGLLNDTAYVVTSCEEFGRYCITSSNGNAPLEQRIGRIWINLSVWGNTWSDQQNGTFWSHGVQVLAEDSATDSNISDRILQGRRVAEDRVDVRLMWEWMHQCTQYHGVPCTPRQLAEKLGTRVIDVRARCVVLAPSDCRYVALSYVWGSPEQRREEGKDQLLLEEENYEQLCTPGGLETKHDDLPQTIQDALLLCEMLEERYLWVDALCIKQDDKEDKKKQIANMSSIYGAAVLTIVAGAGSSVNAGLPGVRLGTREVKQCIEEVEGASLITATRPFLASVSGSVWNTRGWTYEEKFLSRRLLIFTDHQMFFHCNRAIWYEDAVLETGDSGIQIKQMQNEGLKYRLGETKLFPSGSLWTQYCQLVSGYSARHLLQRKDNLNAFRGLITELKANSGSDFIWGMPESGFDAAMAWFWAYGVHNPRLRNRDMPSWSWVSWLGSGAERAKIGVEIPVEDARDVRSEVLWLACDLGTRRLIRNCDVRVPNTSQDDSHCYIRPRWLSKPDSQRPGIEISLPNDQLLQFWTQSTYLKVDRRPDNFSQRLHYWTSGDRMQFGRKQTRGVSSVRHADLYDDTPLNLAKSYRLLVRGLGGAPIGAIQLNPEWRASQPDKLEFILICRYASKPEPLWGPGLMALLIERQEGVAFRVQRIEAPIRENSWKETGPEWTFVTLG